LAVPSSRDKRLSILASLHNIAWILSHRLAAESVCRLKAFNHLIPALNRL